MKKLTTKEDISNLLGASASAFALGAAIETGLLEMLAEKPMIGEEVSKAMNVPGKRGYYWLQLLTELGILEVDSHGYVPSSLAKTVLLDANRQERWKHVAADEREQVVGVRNLALHLSDTSVWEAQGLSEPMGYVEKMNVDPERARVFTRLLYNCYQDSRNTFAEFLDLTGVERVMDVGGGSGILSIILARKYPNLKSVIVDVDNVCVEGRRIVQENQLSDRITFHGADFLKDNLPQGLDMVLHCDIGVFGEELFRKLWLSLKPEGRIVVIFHFSPAENAAPSQYLKWAFLDSLKDPDFGFPTVAQIREQLIRAGFQLMSVEQTLPEGYIFIQAQKFQEQK
jgi:SAM-dependent methyltransferase